VKRKWLGVVATAATFIPEIRHLKNVRPVLNLGHILNFLVKIGRNIIDRL
jgi:hypothetical protein